MAHWRVFYDDGSLWTERDADPDDLPVDGVQYVKECHGGGNSTVHQGMDYYAWMGDTWASGMARDLDRWLAFRPVRPLVVLFGRWASRAVYEAAKAKAKEPCPECP